MTESTIGKSHVTGEIEAARTRISGLRVFHVPDEILTFTTIPPEKVESFPAVEVHDVREKSVVDGTLDAIIAAQPRATTEAAEMRWKLVFTDAAAARVLEVYVTTPLRQLGLIGTTYVSFSNETLTSWLYTHFV